MMLNDPCDHRYVLYALGEGLGNLWEASGLPPQPPGVIAGGVRLVSFSALVIGHRTQELARHGIILFYTTSTPTITKTTHWCGIHRHRNTFICMFVFCVLFHSLTDFFTLTVTSFVNQIMKYQFKTLATSIGPIIAMSEGDLSAQKYKHYKPFKIST